VLLRVAQTGRFPLDENIARTRRKDFYLLNGPGFTYVPEDGSGTLHLVALH
jgi:hypothetical protein